MLRRFVVLALAGLLALSLIAGCGGPKQEEPAMEETTPPATEQPAADTAAAMTDTAAAMQDTTK